MINELTLVGRLAKDPELKATTDGIFFCHITLAVNRSFKNQSGNYDTDFITCTFWKRNAENIVSFCKKGSLVGVQGRVQTRTYDKQDGTKAYVVEVVGESITFLSKQKEEVKV